MTESVAWIALALSLLAMVVSVLAWSNTASRPASPPANHAPPPAGAFVHSLETVNTTTKEPADAAPTAQARPHFMGRYAQTQARKRALSAMRPPRAEGEA